MTGHDDVARLLAALLGGGVAMAPCPVGYVYAATTSSGVERIFALKGRDRGRALSVAGSAPIEGKALLAELETLPDANLARLRGPAGLVGRLRTGSPSLPSGVGGGGTVAVFVGLGGPFDALLAELRVRGRLLFVTSANRSGSGNVTRAAQLAAPLLEGVEALIDDRLIAPAADGTPSPMVRLGQPPRWLRRGFGAADLATQLESVGFGRPTA